MPKLENHIENLKLVLAPRLKRANIEFEALDRDASLVDYGIMDSLDITEVLLELEKVTGSPVDFEKLDFDNLLKLMD